MMHSQSPPEESFSYRESTHGFQSPDCARQNNIPHSMEAASKRLELRRKLRGEVRHA
jgi:hypothetical protein